MPQGNRWYIVYWWTHPQGEQNETEKCGQGVDWLPKGLWYGPIKLDDKLLKNIHNIWQSYKVFYSSQEKMESRIDHRKWNFS